MRVVGISDLHGRLPNIPACDVLLIAGDICPDFMMNRFLVDNQHTHVKQMEWLETDYAKWERTVPATRILATPGNHDRIHKFPENCRSEMFIDELVEVQDPYQDRVLKFWFTPWSICPDDRNFWAYQQTDKRCEVYFNDIPKGLDVLVMHSPAYNCGDLANSGDRCGSRTLRNVIHNQKPRYALYGHIHEGQRNGEGNQMLGMTRMRNCAIWGATWKPVEITL